ncbi:hypothetical protein NDU88_001889 [Pleurodeles waltl]|uniref:Uncharacterized protein n=1 Tax=Pleurodeles waltl TaxID=8319 RepID=A0AAV7W2V9_PLEWA|nr:hypothetical protein NDU88_001889 [Pleurodeles waltl]
MAERQLSRPRGLREPLRPAPACPQRRKYTRILGRRHREVRSPRRLGEGLSQRGRTEPLGDRAKRQVQQENTIVDRGFQSRVTGLEQRMGSLETQINTSQEREQDFLYLRSKLTDMEDRSRRDNICLLGIPGK